jgi:hypothetical protein
VEKSMSPEEAAASWKERRIYDPLVDGYGLQTEAVIHLAHLCTSQHMPEHFPHMPEHAQTCLYKPAHACTTEELPSPSRRFTKTPANSRKFQQDRGIVISEPQAIV